MPLEKENSQNNESVRPLLLKYLKAEPGQKPLTAPEYQEIREFVDIRRGGLKRDAWEQFKEDKEVTKAAKAHRLARTKPLPNPEEVRDTVLKFLKAPDEEKTLSSEEYKEIVQLLDFKKGGLNRKAYDLFRDDKEIVEAAKEHRNKKQETGREKLEETKEETLAQVRSKRTYQTSKSHSSELEPGE